ncbi:MAG: hypothetical protein M1465_02150 [Candidatus Marsarchaeota archaeon]|jgi:hypothetical protein|nr:hypothetical protein [Candidatus Marsarchaeota archaeon]
MRQWNASRIFRIPGMAECIAYVFAIPLIAVLVFGREGALIAVLSSSAFAMYYTASSGVRRKIKRMREEQSLTEIMSMSIAQHRNGIVSKKAISNSIIGFSKAGNAMATSMLDVVRMMQFVDFKASLNFAIKRNNSAATLNPVMEQSDKWDAMPSIKSYYGQSTAKIENTLSLYLRKASRYFTVQMLFSTILPSFALFGIAGYAILYSNASILPVVFSIFAVLLPLAYLLSSKTTAVIYNAAL